MSTIGSLTQVGSRFADLDTAAAIRVHTGGAGLLLGANERGRPVTVSFFRPEPTVVTSLGSLGLIQLIAFRAFALGAQLVITTGRPSAWTTITRAMTETDASAVRIEPPHHQPDWYGSSSRPYLLVIDSDSIADIGAPPSMPAWSTVVMVREHVTSWDAGVLSRADLTIAQVLKPQESSVLCAALNIPDYQHAFTESPDETIGAVAYGSIRWARLAKTALERRLIDHA